MGAALQDLRSHERWIVLDMILDTPPAGVPEAADENGVMVDAIQYCDPSRPTTFIPMPGKRHRWEFMLMPGDDPVKIVQPDSIYNLLRPWNDRPRAFADRTGGRLYVPLVAGDVLAARPPDCSPAIPRIRCRRFSDKAWPPACATPSISPGSCATLCRARAPGHAAR